MAGTERSRNPSRRNGAGVLDPLTMHNATKPRLTPSDRAGRWVAILAGGDGVRVRALTRRVAGDDRPKQFCALVGNEPLLTETRRRAALVAPARRTFTVVTHGHEPFYRPLLADMRTSAVVVQPENRGTAPAILYTLLRIAAWGPHDLPVAFLPSDHFISDEAAFMAHVDQAFEGTRQRPDLVALLGVTPDSVESGYGWIEPGPPVAGLRSATLIHVRGFCEKPSDAEAEQLRAQGWLWNSFVVVGRMSTLLALIKLTVPTLFEAFARVRRTLGTLGETEAIERLYCALPLVDFSRHVLAARPDHLAVLPVQGMYWSDLGDPGRVLATRRRMLETAASEPVSAQLPV